MPAGNALDKDGWWLWLPVVDATILPRHYIDILSQKIETYRLFLSIPSMFSLPTSHLEEN